MGAYLDHYNRSIQQRDAFWADEAVDRLEDATHADLRFRDRRLPSGSAAAPPISATTRWTVTWNVVASRQTAAFHFDRNRCRNQILVQAALR